MIEAKKAKGAAPAAAKERAAPYHHGSLHEALIKAAEDILRTEGLQGLTLRAAARAAGVSHAAPTNHFGDIRGLLSELAAVGFVRFHDALEAKAKGAATPAERGLAFGEAYVEFATAQPDLFLLMFRGERLDLERPALKAAIDASFVQLAQSADRRPNPASVLDLDQAAQIAGAWSLVHGFAMLMIDGRLKPLLQRTGPGVDEMTLLRSMLRQPRGQTGG
ncbi:WHG domain-containing protein [Phreatobacter aquaticus]|uniref:WHG domain-containing protein n=1 Tax=Phreatobacter aquaticus TaxID=2570229 RepID=A0A4D7QGZ8_9HYPH|nr:TetR-like C-terminal domain-containing protein [Phreatobacter aquaticus]QCK84736.1 WHG domain-containing protein [Phreatobacter aquaticus]